MTTTKLDSDAGEIRFSTKFVASAALILFSAAGSIGVALYKIDQLGHSVEGLEVSVKDHNAKLALPRFTALEDAAARAQDRREVKTEFTRVYESQSERKRWMETINAYILSDAATKADIAASVAAIKETIAELKTEIKK